MVGPGGGPLPPVPPRQPHGRAGRPTVASVLLGQPQPAAPRGAPQAPEERAQPVTDPRAHVLDPPGRRRLPKPSRDSSGRSRNELKGEKRATHRLVNARQCRRGVRPLRWSPPLQRGAPAPRHSAPRPGCRAGPRRRRRRHGTRTRSPDARRRHLDRLNLDQTAMHHGRTDPTSRPDRSSTPAPTRPRRRRAQTLHHMPKTLSGALQLAH